MTVSGGNMTAHFKSRNSGKTQELRLLTLDELEEIPEDDELIDPLDPRRRVSLGHPHQCPRCEAITQVIGSDPYCPECNWDSLTDPCLEAIGWPT
jgi:hypothetical protein